MPQIPDTQRAKLFDLLLEKVLGALAMLFIIWLAMRAIWFSLIVESFGFPYMSEPVEMQLSQDIVLEHWHRPIRPIISETDVFRICKHKSAPANKAHQVRIGAGRTMIISDVDNEYGFLDFETTYLRTYFVQIEDRSYKIKVTRNRQSKSILDDLISAINNSEFECGKYY